MKLEISPYFTYFTEMLAILSEHVGIDHMECDKYSRLQELLNYMEFQAISDSILNGQASNVIFYRSSINNLFFPSSTTGKKLDFITSLYQEKVSLQNFYVQMKGAMI